MGNNCYNAHIPIKDYIFEDQTVENFTFRKEFYEDDYVQCLLSIDKNEITYIICALANNVIKIFKDNSFNEPIKILEEHKKSIRCLEHYKKKNQIYLISGGEDNLVYIWELFCEKTKPIIKLSGHSHIVKCVSYYQIGDQTYIVSGGYDNLLIVWKISEYQSTYEICKSVNSFSNYVYCISKFERQNSEFLATGSYDNFIKIWKINSNQSLNFVNPDASLDNTSIVSCLALKNDNQLLEKAYLLSGSDDGIIRVWNLNNNTMKLTLETKDPVEIICIIPLKYKYREREYETGVSQDYIQERNYIVSGHNNGVLRLWDILSKAQLIKSFEMHSKNIFSLCCVENNNDKVSIITGGRDNKIIIWS